MLRLFTCARDLSSLVMDRHDMFAVLSPKDICKAEVFSVLFFPRFFIFIHLQCRNDESLNKWASVWTSSKGFMRFFSMKSKSNLLSRAHKM